MRLRDVIGRLIWPQIEMPTLNDGKKVLWNLLRPCPLCSNESCVAHSFLTISEFPRDSPHREVVERALEMHDWKTMRLYERDATKDMVQYVLLRCEATDRLGIFEAIFPVGLWENSYVERFVEISPADKPQLDALAPSEWMSWTSRLE